MRCLMWTAKIKRYLELAAKGYVKVYVTTYEVYLKTYEFISRTAYTPPT